MMLTRTNKLKPVTEAKEVAIEAPESASSPRWPTYITEITCKLFTSRLTDTNGPTKHSCFFTSATISSIWNSFLHDFTPFSSAIGSSNGWRLAFFSSLPISLLSLLQKILLKRRASKVSSSIETTQSLSSWLYKVIKRAVVVVIVGFIK